MASYADAMVATAGLLAAAGLPATARDYWSEHSDRAVLPNRASVEADPSGG